MKKRTARDYIEILIVALGVLILTVLFSYLSGVFDSSSSDTVSGTEVGNYTVIIIDAGHGGEDGGASSEDGLLEKDINLSVAKYLQSLFALSDINAVMTRNDDRLMYESGQERRKKYYDVRNRVAFAKPYENSFFLSIHQNKFPIKKYNGLQVYYSGNNPESELLAKAIQDNTKKLLQPDNKRPIKKAGSNIYILDKLEVPAVLVECGFLSNYEESLLLRDKEYQKKLAFVIFASVVDFMNM